MRTEFERLSPSWPEAWQAAYRLLQGQILQNQLTAWIQPLEITQTERTGNSLDIILSAPNDFSANWVRDHFSRPIQDAFSQVSGMSCRIRILSKDSKDQISATAMQNQVAPAGLPFGTNGPSTANSTLSDGWEGDSISSELQAETERSSGSHDPIQESVKPRSTLVASSKQDVFNPHSFEESSQMAGWEATPAAAKASASYVERFANRMASDTPSAPPAPIIPSIVRVQSPSVPEIQLNPLYTFDTFVVGSSNQFAHAAAFAVAERPAHQYNPLFIFSHPGLGKTHLLHAIGNHVRLNNPQARVAYIGAERFLNEMVESLSHNRMPHFRAKYRDSYDLIMIDDIQFIAGKGKTEEEFFHTFNALHSSKRQIIITSDRPPKDIDGLEERIRTRFEWGLVADIASPDIETRIAILKSKAEREDIYLSDEVATFLATYVKDNIRTLEGHLVRLQAQASLAGAEISLDMVKQQLKTMIPEEGVNYTVEMILAAVSKHFHVKISELKSNSRVATIALPRQIAMYLIRRYTGVSLAETGSYFGGKNYTTVMHACRKIEESLDSDPEIREALEAVQSLL